MQALRGAGFLSEKVYFSTDFPVAGNYMYPEVTAERMWEMPLSPVWCQMLCGCRHRWLPVIAVAFSLAGCAAGLQLDGDQPGLGVPKISHLELIPDRLTLGCPATLRFHFEDVDSDVLRAVGHWEFHHRGRLYALDREFFILPIAAEQVTGRTRGEASVPSTPERAGRYVYHVQVEDVRGRKSNVLEGSLMVDHPCRGPTHRLNAGRVLHR